MSSSNGLCLCCSCFIVTVNVDEDASASAVGEGSEAALGCSEGDDGLLVPDGERIPNRLRRLGERPKRDEADGACSIGVGVAEGGVIAGDDGGEVETLEARRC